MAQRQNGCTAVGLAGAAAIIAMTIGAAGPSWAAAAEADASGKLPRFESLRADKVNLRTGPGDQYPIEWVLKRRDMPVEILVAVEHWRKIRDWEGTLGWVHEKMVHTRRAAMVTGGTRALHQNPAPTAPIVARAEAGVIGRLLECQGGWCRIEAGDYSGWVQRGEIWGVYPSEALP